ncbi:RNA polymerase sigma factor [Gimesia maris]|jgi:RNA polymerase sigma-70 factor (ECF subfamily)|uniref:RNA polymerase subunit sigma-70 n=1 Tax=Gimesia maris TaxID=122 RepID=A0A3D3R6W0_9PLAN|nr:RNA polymerase sigma factor [Gimesia maris]MAC55049.1 RNA polymerase subunit sigma-70 [Gimesia sp.]QDT82126.1 RNA polymerase sigma factor CnrH [Gimesia maris]HCO24573.1 RNA polymerase subunit sigma-70 [Gimesia maris]|tara:strand:+ start:26725 stop:27369 length:645 start_codon:yes stop_codon:yes gene_type:complete
MPIDEADQLLVSQIKAGDAEAWSELIARYEGRLLAFVNSRLRNQSSSEDVVQETFLGFLISLPNYDPGTPLESFLFAIASHKLTDLLRKQGRRPTIPLFPEESGARENHREPAGHTRVASSLARSKERKSKEEQIICVSLQTLIDAWIKNGEFERLQCIEQLFVSGKANKEVALQLQITEQAVANHKHFVVGKLKDAIKTAQIQDADLDGLGLN